MKKNKFIPVTEPDLRGNELKYVTDCIKTNWISSNGSYVTEFGEKFSRYCDVKYGVPVSNGTTALHLALLTLGIGPGDEVLVPGLTFVATANAVLYVGAKPVFLESDAETWCLDSDDIENKITKHTKAIIPVHLYGHPAEMDSILRIAGKYNLYVIEDAAEAHGALYNGKKVGSFGHVACFSFFGNKTITTGEGGMVITNNKQIVEKLIYLRDGARNKLVNNYFHTELGYNYALTNLQAAVGVAQLERIGVFISKKRKIASIYRRAFRNYDKLDFSPQTKGVNSTFWMSSVVLRKNVGITRDYLIEKLAKFGIQTRPFFYPLHKLPYINDKVKLPVTEYLAENGLNLPSGVTLKKEDIGYIADTIKKILK
jgi:perosamine synthetase